jgi:enoyl-[acyl-carrier protein] reductase/trans-2-enoyl-CoA reductase (NAD+)
VAVLKSVVTQASSAIPVMPLYLSMVFKIMQEKGVHEGTQDQLDRMYRDRMYRADGAPAEVDEKGRLRLDDWELRDDVQDACKALWPQVTTENLFELTDYAGYKKQFLNLFGFERADVNYDEDVATDVKFDCVEL